MAQKSIFQLHLSPEQAHISTPPIVLQPGIGTPTFFNGSNATESPQDRVTMPALVSFMQYLVPLATSSQLTTLAFAPTPL